MLSFSNAAAEGIEPSAIRLRVLSLGAGVQLDLWPNECEGVCGV